MKKIIIVGGVAGGATAAARLRRLDEKSKIIMFERGADVSFANCGLPYYIGDIIKDRSKLLVQTKESLTKRYDLDIRTKNEVISINREKKTIKVKNLENNEIYEENYDYLILSPGASPIVPQMTGLSDVENVFTLRNLFDTDKIKSFISEKNPQNAVVIGGGFIGLEMAENLHNLGLKVTIVESGNQVLNQLDFEMASILHQFIKNIPNVNLVLSDPVKGFENKGEKILLDSGKVLNSDITILSIGVRPENTLAKDAGLETGAKGGIVINEFLQTSDPHIFAIGDAVEVKDFVTNNPVQIPLAWPANRMGRIVADNTYGKKIEFKGSLGTAIVKVFDLTAAVTGVNEKFLKAKNIDYKSIHIHPLDHAGYYPGASTISLKLLFDPTSEKILGAQAVGKNGVDKRIDVLSTAIKSGVKASELADLELAYAPQFSSAKDPVNMLGYIAQNIIEDKLKSIDVFEVEKINTNENIILDVRDPDELVLGVIENSINIPLKDLRNKLETLDKSKNIYIYCQAGLRGYIAQRILKNSGFNACNISGGYKTYSGVYKKEDTTKIETEESGRTTEKSLHFSLNKPMNNSPKIKVDATGLQCPGPIQKAFTEIQKINAGEIMEITATEAAFLGDIQSWANKTGNKILNTSSEGNLYKALVQKGSESNEIKMVKSEDGVTIIIMSGDYDKAIAAFIIANGAAAMNQKVTLFFTFWGLNILRKSGPVKVKKDLLERMFGFMMPKGIKELGLSRMNMFGIGPLLIKYIMRKKNVASLEDLMKSAISNNVKLIACSMSMDVMGIKKEELISDAVVGGVATYLEEASNRKVNLFI